MISPSVSPATRGAYLAPADAALRRRLLCVSRGYWIKATDASYPKGRLIGLHGLVSLLGVELAARALQRAHSAKSDKITCRYRRGLKITFYVR